MVEGRSIVLVSIILLTLSLGLFTSGRFAFCSSPSPAPAPLKKVLILYDSAGESGWRGKLYSICLQNLLGHFQVAIESRPVETYLEGEAERFDVIFYVGAVYENKLPDSFRKDVLKTERTVCWLGHNLWQVAWGEDKKPSGKFEQRFGFRFGGNSNSAFNLVLYRGYAFTRRSVNTGLGLVTLTDTNLASEMATCLCPEPHSETPYIVRGRNFWYVADVPFAYVTMSDRYLVFADLLHDVLDIDHERKLRALVRIEDVHGLASPEKLVEIADLLRAEGVPFSVAVIPVFQDPRGVYNFRQPQTIPLSKNKKLVSALKYMVERGGEIVLHGYTHQWRDQPNPKSGVSAEDYEFFRVRLDAEGRQVLEGPVPEDSQEWVADRVGKALLELKAAGLSPVAWETPHYLASELDNRYFGRYFKLMVHRGIYFVDDGGTLRFSNQFFPYLIESDFYGQRIAPENLYCYASAAYMGEPPSTVPAMLYQARLNQAVRDGWASFFFHWYQDVRVLKELVQGLKNMGYEFVSLGSLAK